MYPRLEVDLKKILENSKFLSNQFKENNLKFMAVTKSFCAFEEISRVIVEGGAEFLADSRIENLEKAKDLDAKTLLLRLPMQSEVEKVVKYADYSLNSEISTISKLSEISKKLGKVHNVILMLDLGDLREGVLPVDVDATVESILELDGVKLAGIGVNLTCYGGVIPDKNNLGQLADIANHIEEKYKLKLEIISGGNSSSLYLIDKKELPSKINSLRIGETLVLGRETAYGNIIEGMHTDAFKLAGEVIEVKKKGSSPIGEIGMDAFGNHPVFEDKGDIMRAIVAIGRQDVNPDGLSPLDSKIEILGASSDHLLLDITNSETKYKVGDIIRFDVDYGALLSLSTSNYIKKEYMK
ncbi:MAG: ornithine racemase Orr [Acidaminobacteraceae bacterium]